MRERGVLDLCVEKRFKRGKRAEKIRKEGVRTVHEVERKGTIDQLAANRFTFKRIPKQHPDERRNRRHRRKLRGGTGPKRSDTIVC